jgi:hypothetical protein
VPSLGALVGLVFSSLCGLVSLELFGQFTSTVTQFVGHFDHQLARLSTVLGLPWPA